MIRLGRGGRKLRIAYGRIFHEACAYSPQLTTQADFENMHRMEGDRLARACRMRGSELEGYLPAAELTGFVTAARAAGDVQTVPLASSLAVPNGPLEQDCFRWLLEDLIRRLEAAGPVDGVYLALHGSMQVDGLEEAPEAVILRRVRAAIGDEAKIAVSYDLHANLSAGLLDPVEILIGYRTNPHWDLAPTGFRAGNRLIRSLRGQVTPTHAWRKMPMVLGGGTSIDFLAPMREVFGWMKKLERQDPRVLSASLFMVHPFTAADDLGWAAHICTDDDPVLAAQLADELADRAWAKREVPLPEFVSPKTAITQARDSRWRRLGPVTLVDCDDIVGAGAPGGNTHIVKALLEHAQDLVSFVPVHDPAAIKTAWPLRDGATLSFTLRGTPGYGMPEVEIENAKIVARAEGDSGRVVRLDVGELRLVICERPPLPIHPKFFRALDLEPRGADIIVQKNFFHYRMFYAAISFAHIPVESDGATSLGRVKTRTGRVPVFPSADPSGWRQWDPELRRPAAWAGEVTRINA